MIVRWGLIYLKVCKDKLVNKCRQNKILLDNNKWYNVIRLYSHDITILSIANYSLYIL